MSEDPERDRVTIQDVIDALTRLARLLPDGFGARVELAICDGRDLQLMDSADLDRWTRMSRSTGAVEEEFVILRGHVHPGENPGELLPGAARDLDRELRELTGEGDS